MSSALLRLVPATSLPASARDGAEPRPSLREALRRSGAVSPSDLMWAETLMARSDAGLPQILMAHGLIAQDALLQVQATRWAAQIVSLSDAPPDSRLIDRIGAQTCLRHGFVPWRDMGWGMVVVTHDPDAFDAFRRSGVVDLGPTVIALASEPDIHAAIVATRPKQLVAQAEARVALGESCRNWPMEEVRTFVMVAGLMGVAYAFVHPLGFISAMLIWAITTMVLTLGLKVAAAALYVRDGDARRKTSARPSLTRYPTVSMIVPLLRERDIAGRLLKRLSRLEYPRELLDICLAVEADDTLTRETLARTDLPPWMRIVTVPKGTIKTKPRALNFALDFCRGSIIGIWDAEDAPEPDQIDAVVARFQSVGPDVACLQGILDYYNPRTNWLSRCFTIEYATWFRLILPGLAKMGFPIPLGGTTLFFRRDVLEQMGGWDAHNVTEDADLGLRLYRYGYRTELVDTVTYEEANCRLWPWVKQRSRWLEGYAMTYAVHMRSPRRLLADLGAWKFFGVQVVFFGTLSQFLLAPILWTFWPALFGLWHPFGAVLAEGVLTGTAVVFFTAEVVAMAVGILAIAGTRHRGLVPFVPTLIAYFPFAVVAAFKGMSELMGRPFYWDKTEHGVFDQTEESTEIPGSGLGLDPARV